MNNLHRKSAGARGKILDITPENAGWTYVGFEIHRLAPGEAAQGSAGDREVILVLVEGRANCSVAGASFGELGERMDVFEKTPPHALYVPNGVEWRAEAVTDCTLAVGSAPGRGGHKAQRLGPDGIEMITRGRGANTRYIHNIAMENDDVADSLLVTEVYTPQGGWSSYPSHRHDVDDFPNVTLLEEIYYHRLNPKQGFAVQRVYTEDGELDECFAVKDGDAVLVPRGHHPCGAPYGYELYYLNVMAGPSRKWRFQNDPDHDWIYQRDLNA